MSYRCDVCNEHIPPRLQQRRHIISRVVRDRLGNERSEIEMEIPVCPSCESALRRGVSLSELRRRHREAPMIVEDEQSCPQTVSITNPEPMQLLSFGDPNPVVRLLKLKKRKGK